MIRLLNTFGSQISYDVHTELKDNPTASIYGQVHGAEITAKDSKSVQCQIDLFMRNVILPLAKETHALILCNASDCALANSLDRVMAPEQIRMGKSCPFTVLAMCFSLKVSIILLLLLLSLFIYSTTTIC